MSSSVVSFPIDEMNWTTLHKHKKTIMALYNAAMDKKDISEIEALETCLAVLEKLSECAPYSAENV